MKALAALSMMTVAFVLVGVSYADPPRPSRGSVSPRTRNPAHASCPCATLDAETEIARAPREDIFVGRVLTVTGCTASPLNGDCVGSVEFEVEETLRGTRESTRRIAFRHLRPFAPLDACSWIPLRDERYLVFGRYAHFNAGPPTGCAMAGAVFAGFSACAQTRRLGIGSVTGDAFATEVIRLLRAQSVVH